MFERFTERARLVVVHAQEEARSLKHDYIGTEHLLLGLLRETDGMAARVLESLDITLERVRGEVVRVVGVGDHDATGQIPFTPRAKLVLEKALLESLPLGHNYIGTEHILLGLISLDDGPSVQILRDLNVAPETIRDATLRLLGPPERQPARLRQPATHSFEGLHVTPASSVRRLMMQAGARALEEGRTTIEPRDVLRALTKDEELGPLLAELGADEPAVDKALEGRPPPATPPQASAEG